MPFRPFLLSWAKVFRQLSSCVAVNMKQADSQQVFTLSDLFSWNWSELYTIEISSSDLTDKKVSMSMPWQLVCIIQWKKLSLSMVISRPEISNCKTMPRDLFPCNMSLCYCFTLPWIFLLAFYELYWAWAAAHSCCFDLSQSCTCNWMPPAGCWGSQSCMAFWIHPCCFHPSGWCLTLRYELTRAGNNRVWRKGYRWLASGCERDHSCFLS